MLDPDGRQSSSAGLQTASAILPATPTARLCRPRAYRERPSFGRLAALGDQLEGVRKRMKDGRDKPDTCPGVAGFTEEDWRALDAIKPIERRAHESLSGASSGPWLSSLPLASAALASKEI